MRKRLILLLTPIAALAAIAVSASVAASPTASTAAAATCATVTERPADDRHRQPGVPAVVRGRIEELKWKINDPSTGKGYESAVAYAIAEKLGYSKAQGEVDVRPLQQGVCSRPEVVRLRHQPDLVSRPRARKSSRSATSYYDVNQALVVNKGTKIAAVRSIAGLAVVQARRTARHDELHVHQEPHQADEAAGRVQRRTRPLCSH